MLMYSCHCAGEFEGRSAVRRGGHVEEPAERLLSHEPTV